MGQAASAGLAGAGLAGAWPVWGQDFPPTASAPDSPPTETLPLPGGPQVRPITTDFPGKRAMILQRTRPPMLETPFELFDKGVFTPNDKFYVGWHWPDIPTAIDPATFRLAVRGNVDRALSLSLSDLKALPKVEVAAVNQAADNSAGFFQPRVLATQWGNGAMGNAKWMGVRLRDVLALAGLKAGSVQVRFRGLDKASTPDAPDYRKSLDINHALDGEVMIATAMNGQPLPLLNGFPIRLVVPGWYSTYWVKMLSDIEVLTAPDENYWMSAAYRVPDNPAADVDPGTKDFRSVPVGRMNPRAFITNIKPGETVPTALRVLARGIAMGGDTGVARVDFSHDGGQSWKPAKLGKDYGPYSFRQWETNFTLGDAGPATLMVRCTNKNGKTQPETPNWNPGGYMRNAIESVAIAAVNTPPPAPAEPPPDAAAPADGTAPAPIGPASTGPAPAGPAPIGPAAPPAPAGPAPIGPAAPPAPGGQ